MPETALINTVAKALLCRRAQVKQIAIVDAKEVEKGKITIESKTEYVLGNSDSIARLADGSHLIVLLGHPPIPRGRILHARLVLVWCSNAAALPSFFRRNRKDKTAQGDGIQHQASRAGAALLRLEPGLGHQQPHWRASLTFTATDRLISLGDMKLAVNILLAINMRTAN